MNTLTKLTGLLAFAFATPGIAAAATVQSTFTTTGNTGLNGTYGQPMTFNASSGSTSLKLQVTAWQSNLLTNAITPAYLGAYSTGLGVTGIGDANGASGYHQIDNAGGYTDFLLLEFNRAVTLSSAVVHSYTLGSSRTKDNDLAFYDASNVVTPQWNTVPTLSNYVTVPGLWTSVDGDGTDGTRTFGATAASTKWLIGAAFTPTLDRDDGFKLSSVSVTESVAAVPEPATWAMMLAGFAAAGGALRLPRRRTTALRQA